MTEDENVSLPMLNFSFFRRPIRFWCLFAFHSFLCFSFSTIAISILTLWELPLSLSLIRMSGLIKQKQNFSIEVFARIDKR